MPIDSVAYIRMIALSTLALGAVLLPAAPTGTARSFLEHVAADCFEVELIYPHGETFRHEQLT